MSDAVKILLHLVLVGVLRPGAGRGHPPLLGEVGIQQAGREGLLQKAALFRRLHRLGKACGQRGRHRARAAGGEEVPVGGSRQRQMCIRDRGTTPTWGRAA